MDYSILGLPLRVWMYLVLTLILAFIVFKAVNLMIHAGVPGV